MNVKKMFALLLAVMMLASCLAGCVKADPTTGPNLGSNPNGTTPNGTNPNGTTPGDGYTVESFEGDFIYKDAVVTLSTNWNPHTYQGVDQSYPLDFTTSSLYAFMYNDELKPVEGKDPYSGYTIVPELAAAMPVDITAEVKAAHPEYGIPASAETGFAYKIALNPKATFSNGKKITAETYVESMKRLLDPKLMNYRAEDTFTGSLVIAGAQNYLNQGRDPELIDDASAKFVDLVKNEDGTYSTKDGFPVYVAVNYPLAWCGGNTLKDYVDSYGETYFGLTYWQNLVDAMDDEGLIALTDENKDWIVDVITANPAWGETEAELPNYLVYLKTYPESMEFSEVGLYASGEYELTLVLQNALSGFYLYYNIGILSLPLVDIELYDQCLTENDGVWTSTYNTSLDTTVSYGPYMMSDYQTDKSMTFVRNESWFGYTDGLHVYKDPTDGKYYNMYQTTEIYTQVVSEASTRKMMFLKGQLMGYGLQADDFDQYRNSEFLYATPATTIFFLILNGHIDAIQEREAAADFDKSKIDLETITLDSFRRAMAVSYDKELFASTISPSRSGAYGIIGNLYVYDVDTGARYRDTEQAKKILCDVYSVDVSQYASLDEAVASITGFDPVAGKALFQQAYEEALEAGYITDENNDGISDQTVQLTYSLSADSDFQTKTINYLTKMVNEVTAGTGFEGKIEYIKSAELGDPGWSDAIKAGATDCVLGGWQGSALDPFGLSDLYTNPAKAYDAQWFDATTVQLTLNVNVGGPNANEMKELTMSLKQWSDVLNGTTLEIEGVEYNFGDGQTDVDTRLSILAGIEGAVLRTYNYLPMLQDASMALLSQQVYYVVEEYSPVMSRGGIAYMKYNYNEAEWAEFIASQEGGELAY